MARVPSGQLDVAVQPRRLARSMRKVVLGNPHFSDEFVAELFERMGWDPVDRTPHLARMHRRQRRADRRLARRLGRGSLPPPAPPASGGDPSGDRQLRNPMLPAGSASAARGLPVDLAGPVRTRRPAVEGRMPG